MLAVALLILASPSPAHAAVICADDIVPFGMAVTGTGTAPSCDGSCRAREIKPVCGLVMKICAGQPIPRGYTVDSITSTPGCQCLGFDDDAYVIRYTGPDGPAALMSSAPMDNYSARRQPFGNALCLPNAAQIWLGENGTPGAAYPGAENTLPWWMQQGAQGTGMPPGMPGMPSAGAGAAGGYAPPVNGQAEEEPFRIGQ